MNLFGPLFLSVALGCPTPVITNTSGFEWNDFDSTSVRTATKRCVHHYPKSPCLVKFQKYAERDYRAMCGAKR